MNALATLAAGSHARVASVTGPAGLRRRLLELGLVPGTTITVVRRAPLGDPIEITLRGYALSLRRDEAAMVDVVDAP